MDTVRRHGWQVILVQAGEGEAEPAFAYTVGLGHRARHPELVMSGLPLDLMHRVLNAVAARIGDGHRFDRPGQLVEGALGRVAVVLEELTDVGLRETVTWSGWFHRARPSAHQLVWPDVDGVWPWQDGAPAILDLRQPPAWRHPGPREGLLAPRPIWPMPTPAEAMAFVCTHVADDGEAILFVARERDDERGEEWSFHCGADHGQDDAGQIRLWHLSHALRAAPSVVDLSDLPMNSIAWRPSVDEPWTIDPRS